MIYGTVCSGIEAPTVAWHGLGWVPAWFSEIEPFPCRLLRHYYPDVPNLGDMKNIEVNEIFRNTTVDLICGGTPCQDFSLAGLRGGLGAARGNLTLIFARLLITANPRWFIWENVPGVFSSKTRGQSDFANILTAFRECGYSCAYRVFDAQYFRVPQRRRRVFVVGHFGNDWRPPAAVLFEPESLRGDITPGRQPWQDIAGTLDARTNGGGFPGTDGALNGYITVATLDASYAHTQGASGQDLNHGHSHLVYDGNQITGKEDRSNPKPGDPAPTLTRRSANSMIVTPMVRRFTPLECERLQGFPDHYTALKGAKDTPRYQAIGNSMPVPVMRWIGQRIQLVDDILSVQAPLT